MELEPEKNFIYSRLDNETRIIVKQRTSEIKNLMRLTAENIINIGQKLTEVKHKLGHGSFQNWLRTEFEWSEQTARQFMQVYRWSMTIKNKNFVFSQLGTSALYLLAAPSTPPEARQEILNLVDEGEKINYTRAKSIVNRYKESPLTIKEKIEQSVNLNPKFKPIVTVDKADGLLFRLEISDFGCIVRLYRAEELNANGDLTVGAVVKIMVGRLQGQTARIIDVLHEGQLVEIEKQQINSESSDLEPIRTNVSTHRINQSNLSNFDKIREKGQHLIICHENKCLAVEGSSDLLVAFVRQIEIDLEFVQNILQQALARQNI